MMGWYEPVLDMLDKLKGKGQDKWMACCPVHDDSNPSMSIKLADGADGQRLLFYCFSCGAKGDSVVKSLGLGVGALFEKSRDFTPDRDYHLKKTQEWDDTYILIHESAMARGDRIRYKDHKLYQESMARREERARRGIYQNIIEVKKPDKFL
jgi:hypothetical protein